MMGREDEEKRRLLARISDLFSRAERGELTITPFLSPAERVYAERFLLGRGARFRSYGGYADAERQRIYLLPDYMDSEKELSTILEEFSLQTEIATLRIKGSGYRRLSHRDFLGALLSLGLERSVLGDIAVNEEGTEAFLFCEAVIADFIEAELKTVANDRVRPSRVEAEEWELPSRRTLPISDTVASPRLDAVVAALCGLSREKASGVVSAGLVELNFESEDRPDRLISSGAVISVRGFGKYRILSAQERTKKGRVRLLAEKYL